MRTFSCLVKEKVLACNSISTESDHLKQLIFTKDLIIISFSMNECHLQLNLWPTSLSMRGSGLGSRVFLVWSACLVYLVFFSVAVNFTFCFTLKLCLSLVKFRFTSFCSSPQLFAPVLFVPQFLHPPELISLVSAHACSPCCCPAISLLIVDLPKLSFVCTFSFVEGLFWFDIANQYRFFLSHPIIVQTLCIITDDQLCFIDFNAVIPCSCCFALYNKQKIRPRLTQYATQLVQTMVISCLDYCNALFAGLLACVVKPLQTIQNMKALLQRLHLNSIIMTYTSSHCTFAGTSPGNAIHTHKPNPVQAV